MCSADDLFVRAQARIAPSNAVAALLVLDDGRYVMQLRDSIPHIFYPGHWGCFGGAVDAGEDPVAALARELGEELEFHPVTPREFTRFDFDFAHLGGERVFRTYYEVQATRAEFANFVLREGADLQAFAGRDLLVERRVAPYDAFAIWMHMSRARFAGPANRTGP